MKPATVVDLPLPSMTRVLQPRRAVPADAVRPTRAEVNLANLRHNLRLLQSLAGSAQVWTVLKADGYGHGAKAVARTLERAGVTGICVALLEEGIELRDAGIKVPILVMGGYYGRAWGDLIAYDLTPVVHHEGQLLELAEEVRFGSGGPLSVHLKVDTGMGRLGALPRELPRLAKALLDHPELRLDGLMTHFATADSDDRSKLALQAELFRGAISELAREGLKPRICHAASSAAMIRQPDGLFDLVRPGIAVFGVEPVPGLLPQLRPVMRIRSEIVAIRELEAGQTVGYGATWIAPRPSRIATIPMGYADGLGRAASNRGALLVRGRRAPIAGIVSMDMTMIDVTEVDGAAIGDECVILGSQRGPHGEDSITACEIAGWLGTIPWEVLTSVSRRVPRFYREP